MKFSHGFEGSGETVIFSYAKPYTFSELIDFIEDEEIKLKVKEEGIQKEKKISVVTTAILEV